MERYPLIFKFKELISGPGYLGYVKVAGRVLMAKEEDGSWWLYGVNPGGIAQTGATPNEAYFNFREFFKGVLEDFAADSNNFSDFKEKVKRYIMQKDEKEESLWQEIRDSIRNGRLVSQEPFSSMKRITDEAPASVECDRMDKGHIWTSADNADYELAAAA